MILSGFFFFLCSNASAKDAKVGDVRLSRRRYEEGTGPPGQASLGALVLVC